MRARHRCASRRNLICRGRLAKRRSMVALLVARLHQDGRRLCVLVAARSPRIDLPTRRPLSRRRILKTTHFLVFFVILLLSPLCILGSAAMVERLFDSRVRRTRRARGKSRATGSKKESTGRIETQCASRLTQRRRHSKRGASHPPDSAALPAIDRAWSVRSVAQLALHRRNSLRLESTTRLELQCACVFGDDALHLFIDVVETADLEF